MSIIFLLEATTRFELVMEILQTSALPLGDVAIILIKGAQRRNRTTDTGIFSPLLYRLSYLGIINYWWRKARDSNSKVLRRRFSRPVPYQLG